MATRPGPTQRLRSAARSGVFGTVVAALAFFDGVFIGAPVALLAATFSPAGVFVVAAIAVVLVVVGCCHWVDRRWDDWFAGNGTRIEARLESMRTNRLMRHPVAWIQDGSDRMYAVAAAVANPIIVAALARLVGERPVGGRRIVLGAVAYAIPYVAMWSLIGFAVGAAVRAV